MSLLRCSSAAPSRCEDVEQDAAINGDTCPDDPRCTDAICRGEGLADGESKVVIEPGVRSAKAFSAVLVCGTVNNFSYCVVSGASQDLARHFRMENQTSLLTTAMNTSALLATFVSSFYLLRFQYYTRVRLVLALALASYAGVVTALFFLDGAAGFAVVALASSMGGFGQIVGETTNIAFLQSFPPSLLGAWGAGTGVAGIAGAGVYLLLRGLLHLPNTAIFTICALTLPVYWAAYHYLHSLARTSFTGPRLARALGGAGPKSLVHASGPDACRDERIQPDVLGAQSRDLDDTDVGMLDKTKQAMYYSGDVMFNLVAVYCLEYFIYPGLDDRETLCASPTWYTAMWMSYNVGVTMSRLSVGFFRIRRVWLLTAFQLINVILWTAEVYSGVVRNGLPNGLAVMTAWMVAVGLCGGATYANCMYLFNNKAEIPDNLRELGVNLGFVMSNVGITLSTLSFSWLDVTVLRPAVLYPEGCN